MGIDYKNNEQYPDPTAYAAVKAIENECRALRAFRPIVYICSPYAGDVERNVDAAISVISPVSDLNCTYLSLRLVVSPVSSRYSLRLSSLYRIAISNKPRTAPPVGLFTVVVGTLK